jgi:ABC-type polysaccharide/polyol phosphate transport system ATPase subunit
MLSDLEVAMRLDGVSKRYTLNPRRHWRLRDALTRPKQLFRQIVPREPFWALRNVSLDVRKGEILGVIGDNGSGKSTMLRILVGISPPTTGRVVVNGRIAALLELGSGFHPQVTGRDNAYLNALFMGLSKERARELVPEIIEYSGLHEFADQPVRTYSSGMYLRLAFAVAVFVEPDVLVIDEVIAVGDAEFQQKCLDHFAKLKEQQTTVVIVTHNVTTLKEFADRVIFLDHGRIEVEGGPDEVVDEYLRRRLKASPAARRVFARALQERGLLSEEAIDDAAEQEEALSKPQAPSGT